MKSFIRLGADPEVFAFSKTTGKPASVHDLLPGSKSNPALVPFGAIQVDGVAAEFNIDPADSSKVFLKNIRHVGNILQRALSNSNPDLELKAVPTAVFDQDYFDSLPFEAKELGCEPDYSAYTGQKNPKPATSKPMRTGSGHIHIQFLPELIPREEVHSPEHMERCCALVKELDAVLLDSSAMWDHDFERRELYGSPGSFRPKPYGLEYRVLSNAWLREDWTVQFVFDATYAVVEQFLDGLSPRSNLRLQERISNTPKAFCNALENIGLPSVSSYAPKGAVNDYSYAG